MLSKLVKQNTGSISNLIKLQIKNPTKRYDKIYIDIWYDKYTIKSTFSGVEDCDHKYIDENNRCVCGAWVGNIASETDPIEFYKHIFNLANNLYANELYIRTPKYYPPEYRYYIFEKEINLNFKYVETYTIFDRLVSFNERGERLKQKSFYLIHFSKKKSHLWKSKVVTYKGFNPLFLLNSNSLWVNPYYNEVKFDIDIEFYFCNTNVLKTITN